MHKSFAFLKNPKVPGRKNIIFLDIDGVIQPYSNQYRFDHDLDALPNYFASKYNDKTFSSCDIYDLGAAYFDWDEVALARIKQILRDFNGYIVIHSGWRESVPIHHLKALFKLYDMDEYILDILEPGRKETVISSFIRDYAAEINKYIIIDDDAMMCEFGMNFCHTYDVFDLKDHLYINRFFMQNYYFKDGLTLCNFKGEVTTVKERKSVFDGHNVSVFEIDNIDSLNEYEVLMIYNELYKYCFNNDIWCMILKRKNELSKQYSLINKTGDIVIGDYAYKLLSPKDNYVDRKNIDCNANQIIEEFR